MDCECDAMQGLKFTAAVVANPVCRMLLGGYNYSDDCDDFTNLQ